MQHKTKFVGVVGHIEADWIAKQVQLEDNIAFAKSVHYVPQSTVVPQKFELSATAKYVFGSAIHFISSLPKL